MAAAAGTPASLRARALRWLAQREHSRAELRRKLLALARAAAGEGAPPDVDEAAARVDALLDALERDKLLSTERFVESRVHARASRFGSRRIAAELTQHGLALDDAQAAALRGTELQRAQAVWQRRFGAPATDAAGRARQARFLAGRGFSAEVIRRVVRGVDDTAD